MATDQYDHITQTEQNILNKSQDTTFKVLAFEMLDFDPTANTLNRKYPSSPLNLKPYDYASRVLTNATTVTWTFKSGGVGGTTTNAVVIVYTDATLEAISTITKT